MKDENRIVLAEELFAQIAEWKFPADKFLNDYFRRNRFVGSKDRRFLYDTVYARIRGLGDCPEWLRGYFPADFEDEIAALNSDAPIDLRVNTLKNKVPKLPADGGNWRGVEAVNTPRSPVGLRLQKRAALAFDGTYEMQDEGSQLATIYADVKPDERVLDYCAGAGGKSLQMAAAMENKGEITAHDIDKRKLKTLEVRARRAGARIIQAGEPNGEYDLVLIDAPCSGTGTWRRAPDAKWRLNEAKLGTYIELQQSLLAESSRFVKAGGRLVYITCSLLPDENEEQVEKFLTANSGFMKAKDYLRLTPLMTNTDGFFAASLVRN